MAKQTFTTGQVLTAAQMTSLQQTAMGGGSATAKTASYVLTAADAGTTVIMNSGSATTITVNTALFAAGDTVFIVNQGAGVCTITAGTATVDTASSLALSQYETGQLYFLSTSSAVFSEYQQAAAGGGMTLLNAGGTALSGASTSVSVTVTGYTSLTIYIKDAYGTVDDVQCFMRINGDTASNYSYSITRYDGGSVSGVSTSSSTSIPYIFVQIPSNNTTLLKGNAKIDIFQPTATNNFGVVWQSISIKNGGFSSNVAGAANYDASAAITAVSFAPGSGSWSGGTVYVYGVK